MSIANETDEGSVLDRADNYIGASVPRANAARLVAG